MRHTWDLAHWCHSEGARGLGQNIPNYPPLSPRGGKKCFLHTSFLYMISGAIVIVPKRHTLLTSRQTT